LRNALQQNPLTGNFTVVSDLPTNLLDGTISVDWDGKDPRSQVIVSGMDVDADFTRVFKIKLMAGRSFSPASVADSGNYLVNEKMLRVMGMELNTAIGKPLSFHGIQGNIIGVVQDFNFKPVQLAIDPLVLRINRRGGFLVVRTVPGQTNATIQALAAISREVNPAYPFHFDFLDQDLANLYKGEQQMGGILNLFALLGIFISSLVLYGLSAFMAEQRTKEMGVRKVLGATTAQLVYLMGAGITPLIGIAIAIAIPLSWYAANSWLAEFAYRIHVSWLIFAGASLAVMVIAWLTVSYESVKAALVNPIESLRSE
jgi:putative ABC transport system permease protein